MAYLSLKALLEAFPGLAAAASLHSALQQLPPGTTAVTLDLDQSRDLYSDHETVDLVEVMRQCWPRPAFCLARCDSPLAWQHAAAAIGHPLLSWHSLNRQGGYQLIGRSVSGTTAVLLRALCLRYDRATAGQLSRDSEVTSPDQIAYDPCSLLEYARTSVYPVGPTQADEIRISDELRRMAQQRLILQLAPSWYGAVLPAPPSGPAYAIQGGSQ